jgi:hypothetical protein
MKRRGTGAALTAVRLLQTLQRRLKSAVSLTTSASSATHARRAGHRHRQPAWGGTGKTPVVEKFARELHDQAQCRHPFPRYRSSQARVPMAAQQNPLPHDTTPPRVCPTANRCYRFRNRRRRTLHARVNLKGRGRARTGPGQERPLCHRKIWLRHAAARRRQYWKLRGRRRTSC